MFEVDVTEYSDKPWIPGLPTLRDPSYLSNIRIVKISASTHRGAASDDYTTFKIELASSEHVAISSDRTSYHGQRSSLFSRQLLIEVSRLSHMSHLSSGVSQTRISERLGELTVWRCALCHRDSPYLELGFNK